MIDEPLPEALNSEINAALDASGVRADRRLVLRMLRTAIGLGEDGAERLGRGAADGQVELWERLSRR